MVLNKSGFTLTKKEEGRSLSGLTVKTSGSIVLVYIMRLDYADDRPPIVSQSRWPT